MGIRARRALISTHATRGTYAWNNPALHARVFAKTLLYSKCLTASLRRRVSTSWHALLHLSELENSLQPSPTPICFRSRKCCHHDAQVNAKRGSKLSPASRVAHTSNKFHHQLLQKETCWPSLLSQTPRGPSIPVPI